MALPICPAALIISEDMLVGRLGDRCYALNFVRAAFRARGYRLSLPLCLKFPSPTQPNTRVPAVAACDLLCLNAKPQLAPAVTFPPELGSQAPNTH